jgi:hypothetical protein
MAACGDAADWNEDVPLDLRRGPSFDRADKGDRLLLEPNAKGRVVGWR